MGDPVVRPTTESTCETGDQVLANHSLASRLPNTNEQGIIHRDLKLENVLIRRCILYL